MLERGWRWLATGFVLVMFGVGSLVVSLTIFPALRLSTLNRETARLRLQRGMHHIFRAYVRGMKLLGLLTLEVHGVERLWIPGRLLIANHPSMLDAVFLVSLMPRLDCIVKRGLWYNPFLRWTVLWTSYIPNLNGETLVHDCAATLRRGNSLLVFPEGTRTRPGERMQLMRGAARIALASGAPILPVTITVSEPTLTKGYPWYRVPRRRPHFCIKVGEPWAPSVYNPHGESGALAARRLTSYIGAYYASIEGVR